MAFMVKSPGSCGEFLQGALGNRTFLVTCPINRYTHAVSDNKYPFPYRETILQPKSLMAKEITLKLLGKENVLTPIYMTSEIHQGKGMASSSADISAVAMATAMAHGRPLEYKELERIALSIEPSDAIFYPFVVQFDYLRGEISRPLGLCPPMKILIFDQGGEVDTIAFNQQPNLRELIKEKEGLIEEALYYFEKGIKEGDSQMLGQACTLSSFANQRILNKPDLYEFHEIGQHYRSLGTVIAHSGSIMGLLFPFDSHHIPACAEHIRKSLPQLTYVDTVDTTNEGIRFEKI